MGQGASRSGARPCGLCSGRASVYGSQSVPNTATTGTHLVAPTTFEAFGKRLSAVTKAKSWEEACRIYNDVVSGTYAGPNQDVAGLSSYFKSMNEATGLTGTAATTAKGTAAAIDEMIAQSKLENGNRLC